MANGLMQSLAASGRKGDTLMAHMTPGEVIIPKEVAALRPDLVAHVQEGIRRMGGDASKYVAGNGRVNPATGAEEFATQDEITAAYQSQLGRAPDAEGLAYWSANPDAFANGGFQSGVQAELSSRPATTGDVDSAYTSLFGRPAETSGQSYWNDAATKNNWTSAQLHDAIASGAQNEDLAAEAQLKNGGSLDKNWQSTLNVNTSPDVHWDAANQRWGPVPKQPTAVQAAQPGLMAVQPATAANYDPTLSYINAPTDTVQGQIDAIIAKNSPLMQRVGAGIDDEMTARGLQSSSLAVGARQAALLDKAIPIAAADANAYNATRFNNQNASNTGSQFNANAKNQVSLANMDVASRMSIADAQIKSDINKFNASQSNDLIKLGMDRDTRTGLANIEAGYKTLLQSSASASDLYKQALTSMTSILGNKDIGDKSAAMNDIVTGLNEGLGILGNIANLNLGSLLTFSNPSAQTATDATTYNNNKTYGSEGGGGGGDGGGDGE
jgi:hypothetical protein